MKEITERNLFGWILKGLDGENKKIKIIEFSGEETVGTVIGYSRGGYIVNGETIDAAVAILSLSGCYRIKINNVDKLFIED